jgi:aromatic-L-amino-acid decarboxylase
MPNELNRRLLDRLQGEGEAFVSNAVLGGKFVLRACIVNFRNALADVEALPEIVARCGRRIDAAMRPRPTAQSSHRVAGS